MKIGILTLPLHTNYGGILQAYALQTVLERMGHDVKIIAIPFVLPSASFYVKIKRVVKMLLGRFTGYINFEEKFNLWLPIASKNLTPFIDSHLKLAHYNNYTYIGKKDFDCICVGSDQIWRPKMLLNDITNAFLSFTVGWNIKRIAYSASFGTDEWEYSHEETINCQSLVKLFDAVSVRECGGLKLCNKYLGVEAIQTLDPTMLLDFNDYNALIKESPSLKQEKILFSYILDVSEYKTQLVEDFAAYSKLKISKVDVEMGNKKCDVSLRILPSVEFWLKSFRDSEFVITDSFHACVFSIIFKKSFAVLVNEGRGAARFYSLLSMFGLEDRIVTNLEEIKLLHEINYDFVFSKLDEMKQKSYNYLNENL